MSSANVAKLRAALTAIADKITKVSHSAVENEARDLAAAIAARAPRGETGNLAKSVQAIPVNGTDKWRVQAGGDLTTKEVRKGSGKPYDYARSTEFGTVKEKAKPFFWPVYRARKDGIKQRIAKAVASQVK